MAKAKLTAGRIEKFHCPEDKKQSFLWCDETPGLGVRATTGSDRKRYIFQTKVNGKSMRVTIGDVSMWSIAKAQAEARRLQVLIDQGNDPRQVEADKKAAAEAKSAALRLEQATQSLTVAEAWESYIAERSAATKDGKPEWGERHKAHLAYFVQAGGNKRTRGRRPNEPEITRPGLLVPFMAMRLVDVDAEVVSAWLHKEASTAPTNTAKAFSVLRAFLTWCAKKDEYRAAVNLDACRADQVKKKVPGPKTKKNDSLRRAQVKPWFDAVRRIGNPVISAYLQALLLTGARRNELATLRWHNVDFQWKSLTIRDKVEGERTIPLTPYVEHLISPLPRRNEFVFSSPTAASGRLEEPRNPHNKALRIAALPALSLHGLRRSFGTLAEWVEVPTGIVAQLMGHKPSAIAEKHYIQRELDLLYLWHVKIEAWILEQAGIEFIAEKPGLQVVRNT
ncbi:tyrosine-type recombinase/integrase [Nitrosospira multiformis]|uniref:tyrosine-type recombinase/integrase n=1 Tax=Nitrosospira multiformis TaxID=1231 RepID=UPI000899F5C5|nr:integrase family protein [Nitrosospira multiformis]SEA73941.1 Site-specific recombinase XerD [Nitrosospira multiformis]